eukprot:1171757-Pleurochrysis_carterae.AAC.1
MRSSSPVYRAAHDQHPSEARLVLSSKATAAPPPAMSRPPSSCPRALLASRLRRSSPHHKLKSAPNRSS